MKGRRDRRLSIEDDFWFRKVITPTTIEPILEGIAGLLEGMPVRSSPSTDQSAYALKVTTEFQRFAALAQTLALFHESLPQGVGAKLSVCEDTLTEYCAGLASPPTPGGHDPSAVNIQAVVWGQVNDALRVIKDQQLAHK